MLSEKNFRLSKKLEHMSKRTTREKLLSYLSAEAIRQGSLEFDIPFNRQQLADYLSVDRSAMSSELGRLQDEDISPSTKIILKCRKAPTLLHGCLHTANPS